MTAAARSRVRRKPKCTTLTPVPPPIALPTAISPCVYVVVRKHGGHNLIQPGLRCIVTHSDGS
jgi:hypothetical protein